MSEELDYFSSLSPQQGGESASEELDYFASLVPQKKMGAMATQLRSNPDPLMMGLEGIAAAGRFAHGGNKQLAEAARKALPDDIIDKLNPATLSPKRVIDAYEFASELLMPQDKIAAAMIPMNSAKVAGKVGEGVIDAVRPAWGLAKKAGDAGIRKLTGLFSKTPGSAWETLDQAPEEVAKLARSAGWAKTAENKPIPAAKEMANRLEKSVAESGAEKIAAAKESGRSAVDLAKTKAADEARVAGSRASELSSEAKSTGEDLLAQRRAKASEVLQTSKQEAEQYGASADRKVKEMVAKSGQDYEQMLTQLAEDKSGKLIGVEGAASDFAEYVASPKGVTLRKPTSAQETRAADLILETLDDFKKNPWRKPKEVAEQLQLLTAIQRNNKGLPASAHAAKLKDLIENAIPESFAFISEVRAAHRAAMQLSRELAPFSKSDTPAQAISRLTKAGGKAAMALQEAMLRIPGFADDVRGIVGSLGRGEAASAGFLKSGKRAVGELASAAKQKGASLRLNASRSAKQTVDAGKLEASNVLKSGKVAAEKLKEGSQQQLNIYKAASEFTPWVGALPSTGLTGGAILVLTQMFSNPVAFAEAPLLTLGMSPRLAMETKLAAKAGTKALEAFMSKNASRIPPTVLGAYNKSREVFGD